MAEFSKWETTVVSVSQHPVQLACELVCPADTPGEENRRDQDSCAGWRPCAWRGRASRCRSCARRRRPDWPARRPATPAPPLGCAPVVHAGDARPFQHRADRRHLHLRPARCRSRGSRKGRLAGPQSWLPDPRHRAPPAAADQTQETPQTHPAVRVTKSSRPADRPSPARQPRRSA
jgi:hypothetical protein